MTTLDYETMPMPSRTAALPDIEQQQGKLGTLLLTALPYFAVAVVRSQAKIEAAHEDLRMRLGKPGDQQGVLFLAPGIDVRSAGLSVRSLANERITVERAEESYNLEQQAQLWLQAALNRLAEALKRV